MEAKIVTRDQIILVGLSYYGDPFAESGGWTEENEIGRLWNRFIIYLTDYRDHIKHVKEGDLVYEVHVEGEETASKGHREVFVGIEVEMLDDVPVELLVKILPPAKYAVFTLRGEQITSDWSRMIDDWMLDAGYSSAYPYGFQLYDQRFKGLDDLEASELDVYLPIKPADETTDSHR